MVRSTESRAVGARPISDPVERARTAKRASLRYVRCSEAGMQLFLDGELGPTTKARRAGLSEAECDMVAVLESRVVHRAAA